MTRPLARSYGSAVASQVPQSGNPDLHRLNMFDGFKPSDFADPTDPRGWPRGRLKNAFSERQPAGLTPEETRQWQADAFIAFAAVRELAVVLEEFLDWARDQAGPPKTAQLADELHISRQRLTGVLKGKNFPQWDLPARIKALINPSGTRKADQEQDHQRRRRP